MQAVQPGISYLQSKHYLSEVTKCLEHIQSLGLSGSLNQPALLLQMHVLFSSIAIFGLHRVQLVALVHSSQDP